MARKSHHIEKHFQSTELVRDIVIGMSDGLTVPFALAAGLTGAVDSAKIIVTAGFAEIAAGAIAMGLGGYLAARTDYEHFQSEKARETRETIEIPGEEANEIATIFRSYGLKAEDTDRVVSAISSDRSRWVNFMMRFELGLEEPNPKRALTSALTIAASYIVGGMVPLLPYLIFKNVTQAFYESCIFTLIALAIFGYVKGKFTTPRPIRSALQTAIIGAIAATTAYLIAKLVS